MEMKTIAALVHDNAVKRGWWEDTRSVEELLCLVHSDILEALWAFWNHDDDNFKEALADIVIRVFDMAEGLGINIEDAVKSKHSVNIDRPYRHGGKVC